MKEKICSKCGIKFIKEKWGRICNKCKCIDRKRYDAEKRDELKIKDKERKSKKYYENRELMLEKSKKYRQKNLEKSRERDRNRYREKAEEIKAYLKVYNEKNRKIILSKAKKYNSREDVKERRRNYGRKYTKNRRKIDEMYNFKYQMRSFISNRFKGWGSKSLKTEEILGCSFQELKSHLESKFGSWMTWENRGLYNGFPNCGWDLDHIIPMSSAQTKEDIIRLNHYTNLQPLCSYVNRYIKRNRIISDIFC